MFTEELKEYRVYIRVNEKKQDSKFYIQNDHSYVGKN